MLHPRTFIDCKQDNGKFNLKKLQERIIFIDDITRLYHKKITEVYLYVQKFIWEKLLLINKVDANLNIFPIPNYNEILFVLNNQNLVKYELKKQFISIDQYNAFASIKTPVYPFIINNKDETKLVIIHIHRNPKNLDDYPDDLKEYERFFNADKSPKQPKYFDEHYWSVKVIKMKTAEMLAVLDEAYAYLFGSDIE